MNENKFYNFVKNEDKKEAKLYIYGEITSCPWGDDDVSASDFQKELNELDDIETLWVYVNSPGGEIFQAYAIYNQLLRFGKTHNVYTVIDGIAASSASFIALAGQKVYMPSNAYIMIHRVWTISMGNYLDFEKAVKELKQFDTTIAGIYQSKTNLDKDSILQYMSDETWFDGNEAKELGFIDVLEDAKPMAACANSNIINQYKNIPNNLKDVLVLSNKSLQTNIPQIKTPRPQHQQSNSLQKQKLKLELELI